VYSMGKAKETVVRTFENGHAPVKDTWPLLIPRNEKVANLINFINQSSRKYIVMFDEVVTHSPLFVLN
jgi:hypothetical protein